MKKNPKFKGRPENQEKHPHKMMILFRLNVLVTEQNSQKGACNRFHKGKIYWKHSLTLYEILISSFKLIVVCARKRHHLRLFD
jgi:hypothetical protein